MVSTRSWVWIIFRPTFYMESKKLSWKWTVKPSKYGRTINSLHQIGPGGNSGGGGVHTTTQHYAQYSMPILLQQGLTWTICVLFNLKLWNVYDLKEIWNTFFLYKYFVVFTKFFAVYIWGSNILQKDIFKKITKSELCKRQN